MDKLKTHKGVTVKLSEHGQAETHKGVTVKLSEHRNAEMHNAAKPPGRGNVTQISHGRQRTLRCNVGTNGEATGDVKMLLYTRQSE